MTNIITLHDNADGAEFQTDELTFESFHHRPEGGTLIVYKDGAQRIVKETFNEMLPLISEGRKRNR